MTCQVVETLRDYRLARRALDGDVGAMVEWLQAFGGREWQLPASMQPDKWQHDPGRGTGLPAWGSTAHAATRPTRVNGLDDLRLYAPRPGPPRAGTERQRCRSMTVSGTQKAGVDHRPGQMDLQHDVGRRIGRCCSK